MTKGYGITVEEIDWSCPADLEPYAKAKNLEMREIDAYMHSMGFYNNIAFEVVMSHFGAGLAGKKSDAKYIEHPLMQNEKTGEELTEEEKQREVDLFFARENARRVNWKRNRGNRSI